MIHTLGLSPSLDVVYEVPTITVGTIHRPRTVRRLAGGKSLNVSRAVARLGAPVRAVVPLGGRIGDLVAETLTGTGVELVRVSTSAPTRMCVSAADESDGGLTEFYEASTADGGELAQVERAVERVPAGEWLALSGSVPPGIELDRLVALLAGCSARGVRVAVDTHGPVLGPLIDGAAPALVKVNRAEAAELAGGDAADLRELGAPIVERFDGRLVITDGARGATAWGGGGSWSVITNGPVGRYPVGSGDCFLAGLVAELAGGRSWPEALVTAAAVGAANAAQPGGAVFTRSAVADRRRATVLRTEG